MSHRHKHHEQHEHNRQNNTGGIIAIMLTIVVTGGLVYLGLSNKPAAAPGASSSTNDSMADHHGGTTAGPVTNVNDLVGVQSPDFTLKDRDGKEYSLASLRGKKVVLFFNEGLMCYPACWNQIASLGADSRFQGPDTVAFSVVVDSPGEWGEAVKKMPELAKAQVLFDTGGTVSNAFGMLKTGSSMHYGQNPGHTYVVFDAEGVIRHVYDDPSMGIHNDALVEAVAKI